MNDTQSQVILVSIRAFPNCIGNLNRNYFFLARVLNTKPFPLEIYYSPTSDKLNDVALQV